MQHGVRTKYHLIDPGLDYGESKWMNHAYARRGCTRTSGYCRWMKHEFVQAERRRGKRECSVPL
jgi:hypothetical protein